MKLYGDRKLDSFANKRELQQLQIELLTQLNKKFQETTKSE